MCAQKEARRFLGALAKRCQLAGSNLITTAQLYSLADDLDLAVPDTGAFISDLNEAGARSLPPSCLGRSYFCDVSKGRACRCCHLNIWVRQGSS